MLHHLGQGTYGLVVHAEAPEAVTHASERHRPLVVGLTGLGHFDGGGEGLLGRVVPAQQREELTLPYKHRGPLDRRFLRDQGQKLVDDGLLAIPASQRLEVPLLLQKKANQGGAALRVRPPATLDPFMGAFEHAHGLLDAPQAGGPLGSRESVPHGPVPVLGTGEVGGEPLGELVQATLVDRLHGLADQRVPVLPLALQQTVVGHVQRESVLEAVGGLWHKSGALDQADGP